MAIQVKVGLRHLQTLPTLCAKTHWVEALPSKDLQTISEDGELNRWKLQYTSLRDLISVVPNKRGAASPRVKEADWCDISQVKFKDRLLKQAARAYLQPIGLKSTPEIHFFTRCWENLSNVNTAVTATIKDYLHTQAKSCARFFRTYAYSRLSFAFNSLFQRFKPQFLGFLRAKPEKKF